MEAAEGVVLHEPPGLLRAIVESCQVAILGVDRDGRVTSWNKAAEATFGFAAEEALGRSFERIVPDASRARLAAAMERAIAGERVEQIEVLLEARDGQPTSLLLSVSPLRDSAGAVVGASLVANDVSVLKARESELARMTRVHAALSQINQTIVLTRDREQLLCGICRALVEHGGFCMAWMASHDPLTDKLLPVASWGDADGYAREIDVYADDRPEGRGPTGSAFQQGKPYVCNDLVNDAKTLPWRAEYQRRGFRASAAFPIREDGKTTGTLNVYADEAGFFGAREVELLSEAATDVSFALDNLRREEELGEANRVLQQQQEEQRELHAQFRHVQKMEAIGRLAAGVAHDFNNVLSVILSYSSLLDDALGSDDSRREFVVEIGEAARRAAGLTKQLLAFSRKQVLRPRVIELSEIVLGAEKMLRRLVKAPVEMSVLTRSRGSIHVDPGQVDQVLLNLVINASDAMPDGGTVIVETSDVELDETYAARHDGAVPGPHALLAVSDTGVGMDSATCERVFEPFFTTKAAGKGTGLGLSTAFGIVRQSGGHVTVESEPGRGTTFRVYFPIVERTLSTPPETHPDPATLRGTETILLVEDDEQVRATAHTVLRRYGYNILDARNAGEALLIAEQNVARIDLLLTDLVMPRMNGRQLAERIQGQCPGVRVLFMSGYAGESLEDLGGPEDDRLLISKPLAPIELVMKVRAVLDEST